MFDSRRLYQVSISVILLAVVLFFSDAFILPYYTSKWIAGFLAASAFVALASLDREFKLPTSKLLLGSLGLYSLFLVYNIVRPDVRPIDPSYPLYFVSLTLIATSALQNSIRQNLLGPLALAFVIALGGVLLDRWFYYDPSFRHVDTVWLFANINMASQFVAGAALTIYIMHRRSWPAILVGLSLGLSIYFRSRSVILATLLAFLISEILVFKGSQWKSRILSASLSLLVAFAAMSAFDLSLDQRQIDLTGSSGSTHSRYHLVTNSLKMIDDRPNGWGLGQFEFMINAYKGNSPIKVSEKKVDLHPHNEFLRVGVEEGAFAGVAFLFLWLVVGFGIYKTQPIYMALFVFWTIEMMFQFPLFRAPSMVLMGLFLGLALHGTKSDNIKKAVFLTAGALLLLGALSYAKTNLRADTKDVIEHCQARPQNWRSCLHAMDVLIADGQWGEARKILERDLEIRPLNLFAFRYAATLAIQENNIDEACSIYQVYRLYVAENSSIEHVYHTFCNSNKWFSNEPDWAIDKLKNWVLENQNGVPPLNQLLVK